MLGHKSLTGKDTFFNTAKDFGFARAAFADKLKETVADLYNLTVEQIHGSEKDVMDMRYPNIYDAKEITVYEQDVYGDVPGTAHLVPNPEYKPYLTPRRILQVFGQQQRSLFPDIWAAYVFNTTIPNLIKQGHDKIVITDFRFKNEAKVARDSLHKNKNLWIKTIKIERPSVIAKTGASDISENDLNDFMEWDYKLLNSNSLEEYQGKVKEFLRDW